MANILIIEDDADIAAIERDYLSLAGYDVTIEPDGTRGLQAALTGSFDLLLLDLMLPGTDGFTICRPVREQKKLPILMVSARTGDADKIRGLGFGADDSIEKPFRRAFSSRGSRCIWRRWSGSSSPSRQKTPSRPGR